MEAFAENSIRFSPVASPSSENRDPVVSSNEGEAELYEEIEAPKFVDFTSLERYVPDDRYWFCFRVGCDQKHEEEMDSEEIYKRFVLRVMAARSPYMKLRKALDRNASKTPLKCPLSAPPKPCKPKFPNLTKSPLNSKKRLEEREKKVNPKSTPMNKCRPIAAKYLSTPRNKKCTAVEGSFRSVQNHKPHSLDASKSRVVAKALFSQTPKKEDKMKISGGVQTPVSTLCEKMRKMEISSKPCKNVIKDSSTRRRLSNSKTKGKLRHEQLPVKIRKPQNDASRKPLGLVVNDDDSLKKKEHDASRPLEQGLQHTCEHSSDENNCNNYEKENGGVEVISEDAGDFMKHLKGKNFSVEQRTENENADDDDKENATVSEVNRCLRTNLDQSKRKNLAILHLNDQVQKVVEEANLKRKNTTNPKPFRLRTDERSILREANTEKKATCIDTTKACANSCTLAIKSPLKQIEIQKVLKKTAQVTPESNISSTSHQGNNAMRRLEMFKKATSPPERHSTRIQRLVSPKKMTSYLIPGQKLDTIHENSAKIWELSKPQKADTEFRRHTRTVTKEPNFHNINVTNKLPPRVKQLTGKQFL